MRKKRKCRDGPAARKATERARWRERAAGTRSGYRFQILLSMNAASWVFESAPTLVASTLPFLKSISVGMPRMPYLGGVDWFSSMLSLATLRRPAYSAAIWSSAGAIILQGPHHSAQ